MQFNASFDAADEAENDAPQVSFPSRAANNRRPPPSADDVWGGQSLAQACAPKKNSPQGGGATRNGSAVGACSNNGLANCVPRGGAPPSGSGNAGPGKSTEEIVSWLRTLPVSHVPEKSRENLIAIVEDNGHNGASFSAYVQQVPPEVCAPKAQLKLKAAWANVLREQEHAQVARDNATHAPVAKGTLTIV